jgi:hypothetical protein
VRAGPAEVSRQGPGHAALTDVSARRGWGNVTNRRAHRPTREARQVLAMARDDVREWSRRNLPHRGENDPALISKGCRLTRDRAFRSHTGLLAHLAWAHLQSSPFAAAICASRSRLPYYDYLVEKRDAFERLAELIERIVNPRQDNVVPSRR